MKEKKTGSDHNKNSTEQECELHCIIAGEPLGLGLRSDKGKCCLSNLPLLSITEAVFMWSLAFLPSNNPKRIKWLLSTYNGPGLVLSS